MTKNYETKTVLLDTYFSKIQIFNVKWKDTFMSNPMVKTASLYFLTFRDTYSDFKKLQIYPK